MTFSHSVNRVALFVNNRSLTTPACSLAAMEIEQNLNTNMEASRAFQNSLKDAPLRIVADRDRFKSHKLEGQEETADETLRDPEFVANDVAAQIVRHCINCH